MPEKMKTAKLINRRSEQRPSAYRRGYDSRHRKLRLEVLALSPVCQICKERFSEHAHHLRYPAASVDDYQALCGRCHMRLHAAEMGSQN